MNKDKISAAFRKYVKDHLSPTFTERSFVSSVYEALCNVLGATHCLQIGSYPRFTANRPLHDLDVLYVNGPWPGAAPNPASLLSSLKNRIEKEFKNPTELVLKVSVQTHSITIAFFDGDEEVFGIDVVPAYRLDTNEFGDDMYMVPEVINRRRTKRQKFYEELARSDRTMGWIKSDPRGYIEVARQVNLANNDFRKSAKFVKAWKCACKKLDDTFKLKSFHMEQIITAYFRKNLKLDIYDAVLQFFRDLPKLIERAQIPDRADHGRNIDQYVEDLTDAEKSLILRARNAFLSKLEDFNEDSDVKDLIEAGFTSQPKGPASPAIITRRSPAGATGFTPRSPWASDHVVKRR
jgi:hypothetical protein